MADVGSEIHIVTTALDPANWTLISAPLSRMLRNVTVRNSQQVDVKIRSDSADPTTEDTIPAGYERTFRFAVAAQRAGLFYAKPVSGTGPLVMVYNA